MFPEAVDWLEKKIGVKRYKIRYADRFNLELLSRVIDTGKPVYISCDRIDYTDEVKLTTMLSELTGSVEWDETHPINTVHCVPKYPPMLTDITLPTFMDGYSNHYPSAHIPFAAVVEAASSDSEFYLEVHVKRDNTHPIDDAVSLPMSEFAALCKCVRDIELIKKKSK
jgi:sialic acid synthase SpsE